MTQIGNGDERGPGGPGPEDGYFYIAIGVLAVSVVFAIVAAYFGFML